MVGAGPIAEALKSILFVGKGGRGGKGGAETVGRRVVPASQWGKRQQSFEE